MGRKLAIGNVPIEVRGKTTSVGFRAVTHKESNCCYTLEMSKGRRLFNLPWLS